MPDLTPHCVMCREDGHTYMECPRVNFWDLTAGVFGLAMPSGKSTAEVAAELQKLNNEQRGDKNG